MAMSYSVQYANGNLAFETDVQCTVAECSGCSVRDDGVTLKEALSRPLSSPGFKDFASNSKKLLFILCDGTRPTPTALILERLHPEISTHPNVEFVIATGTHRVPTEAEFQAILGRHHAEFRLKTSVHDSRDPAGNMFIGTTSRGTPVSLSRKVMEADGIVTINSVEPHYFAGYTGGRKSFLPGVAGFDSIERNHSHAAEPGALPLVLEGNPVSEDMFEALEMIADKRMFSIQTVMTPRNEIYAAFTGNINETFFAAVEKAREIYSAEVSRRANIVITVVPPPMDLDLYQSQKALEHARAALEDGGIIILVSSCWDGIGDRGFYNLLSRLKATDKVSDFMGENYRLGNHKVARLLSVLEHGEIWAVSDLDEGTLKTARIRKMKSLQEAVDMATAKVRHSGKVPRMLVLPSGSLTVPVVVEA